MSKYENQIFDISYSGIHGYSFAIIIPIFVEDFIIYGDEFKNSYEILDLIKSSPPNASYASVNRVSIGSDNDLSPIRHQAIN